MAETPEERYKILADILEQQASENSQAFETVRDGLTKLDNRTAQTQTDVAAILNRLDKLNGKVAEHEKLWAMQSASQPVQAEARKSKDDEFDTQLNAFKATVTNLSNSVQTLQLSAAKAEGAVGASKAWWAVVVLAVTVLLTVLFKK